MTEILIHKYFRSILSVSEEKVISNATVKEETSNGLEHQFRGHDSCEIREYVCACYVLCTVKVNMLKIG